ncbi:S-adenosyl-L-methionine-dependent methyltransferase [Xylariaceae sp. FL1651]|nr:S-adenosyl-L-methionine-dependent methyltransferase [Xylariaceae sp. FL1651]
MDMFEVKVISSRIAANTNKVNDYLVTHNLPTPSFDVNGAQDTLIPKHVLDTKLAKAAIIDDTLELRCLVLGPREYLISYIHDELISQKAITHFRITHSFPTRPCIVAYNAVSRLLAKDQAIHDWVAASTDDLWQAAAQTCNAVEKWPGSEEPNETFSKFPERARRFGNDETVVNVGSQNFASYAIARKFPSPSFVVQDLEPVIKTAETEVPAELSNRIRSMTHNFLTEKPVSGAAVYFSRWIFHNWSDKYCIQILRNHTPALKSGAKIIINDNVLPLPRVMSKWQEDRLRSMDLTMTDIQNSYEREVDDWARLLKSADSRFELLGAKQPPGSNLWLW